jgi:hypothetical protein
LDLTADLGVVAKVPALSGVEQQPPSSWAVTTAMKPVGPHGRSGCGGQGPSPVGSRTAAAKLVGSESTAMIV